LIVRHIKPHQTPENAVDPVVLRYLDAVVELTCQRDSRGLSQSLIDSLRQQVQAERFRLLAISNSNNDQEFNETNAKTAAVRDWLEPLSAVVMLVEDKDLFECVQSQKRVSRMRIGAGGRRLILPIFGTRHVTAMLEIEGMQEVEGEDEMLSRLLRIFGNQAFLLLRNELDGLTGLYNRQCFDIRIQKLVLNAGHHDRRANEKIQQNCLAFFDIDHFKQVNDKYGHLYGDEVLVQLARLMNRSFRHEDLLFRYGGEEFAAVLINVTPEIAVRVLESFRKEVEAYQFPRIGKKSVSIGVVGITSGESVDTIINRADMSMYHAKNNGRNQVCCYETLVAEGKLAPVSVATGDIELF
jgi:diguanylate cyclase (GGDEF)-like protein